MSTHRVTPSSATSVALICSECGEGNLIWRADRTWFTCGVCESEIAWSDILPNLDADDDAFIFGGVVHVSSAS